MVAALWAASRVLHPILDTQFSIFYHLVCVENFKCKNRFSARMCLSPIVTLIFFCFITYFFFHFSYVLSLVFIANPSGKPLKMCSSYERTQEHSTLMPHRIRFTLSLYLNAVAMQTYRSIAFEMIFTISPSGPVAINFKCWNVGKHFCPSVTWILSMKIPRDDVKM